MQVKEEAKSEAPFSGKAAVTEVLAATSETNDGKLKVDVEDLDPTAVQSATEWFLSDAPPEDPVRRFQINVGVNKVHWGEWGVGPMERSRIKEIREATMNRASRRQGGASDDMAANLRIAAEGTREPDLGNPEMRKGPDGEVLPDKADALRYRLRNKPGLIDQIAAEVLAASGYDDEDIRAAGG